MTRDEAKQRIGQAAMFFGAGLMTEYRYAVDEILDSIIQAPAPVTPDKPGRYIMTMPLRLAPCVQRPKEWKEAPECRDCDMRLCISTEEEIYGCLYSFIKQGAKFCRIEEEV